MNKKKLIILGIVLLTIGMICGVTFALWQVTLKQNTTNVIITGCFKIEFQEENPISLTNAYPITDEDGKVLIPYTFTITNTCESYASYQINLEVLDSTTLENFDYLKVMLNDEINLLTENNETTKTLEKATTSYKLKTGYLRENQSKTFSLRLWLDEHTPVSTEFMEKIFESKITVIATYKENLDNNIQVTTTSLNDSYSDTETFRIEVKSENFEIVEFCEDLENWDFIEQQGKDISIEKTVTSNGTYTYYVRDEAGNIKEINFTATKIDDKKPIANLSVTKEANKVKINASESKDNESSIIKYYYSKDGTDYIETTDNTYEFVNEYEYGTYATTSLINYETNQVKKVYVKVEDEVGNISDVKEISLNTDFAYDNTTDNNLRYIGADPNNYVTFNNELWRVIGVMNNIDDGTGKKETRLKIVRNSPILDYSWDISLSNVNEGWGINEWSNSDIMRLLNPDYSNLSVGGSLYWNRTSGDCYNGSSMTTFSCNFTSSGLTSGAKNMISKAVWHIGTNGTSNKTTITASQFYKFENSNNTGKICSSGTACNDNVTRTTTWKGYVGLIAPSDYGYATSGGTLINRENCLNARLSSWDNSNIHFCKENDWLYKSSDMWTITSTANSTDACFIFYIHKTGYMGSSFASVMKAIFPTVYLKPNAKVTNGIGTELSPFQLSV